MAYPDSLPSANASDHLAVRLDVLGIATELGLNPSGTAVDVAARLAAGDTALTTETTARTSADTALGVRIDGKADIGAAVTDAQIPATIARDTEVTAAVVAHEAAADPHPGYLTESSASATYSASVKHGADANVARPVDAGHVIWTGTVTPVNAAIDDLIVTYTA